MKKKVVLMLLCVLLAAMGLAGCSEEKEPMKAAKETAEKPKKIELAEDFEDESVRERKVSVETEIVPKTEVLDTEEVVDTKIRVQPKTEEVDSQEVSEKTKSQEAEKKPKAEAKENVKEKPKQKEQKAETLEEPEKPKETEPPRHTHSWEPVYAERQVEKVKLVPWTKCYCCGADMTGNVYHIDEHLLNDEPNVSYGTEYREETYYETETYISGYSCSCGKTKSN